MYTSVRQFEPIMASKEQLISKRKHIRTSITTTHNSLATLTNLPESKKLATKTKLLQFLQSLSSLDNEIQNLIYNKADEKAFLDDLKTCDEYIDKVNECLATLESVIPPPSLTNGVTDARSLLRSPVAPLPNFGGADEENYLKFITQFNDTISKYKYPECDKFLLLKQQLTGRALVLVDSLEIGKQTFTDATNLLKNAFDSPVSKKFSTVSQLVSLKLDENMDPYIFLSKFTKLAESADLLKMDKDSFLQYFFWNALNEKFKAIFIQLSGETKPSLQTLRTKYFEVCDIYKSLDPNESKNFEDTETDSTSLAVKVDCNESKTFEQKNKFRPCVLCTKENKKPDHPIYMCSVYPDQESKLAKINELGGCQKCGGIEHKSDTCLFRLRKKCSCNKWHFSFLCPEGTTFAENKLSKKVKPKPDPKPKTKSSHQSSSSIISLGASQPETIHSNCAIPTFTCSIHNFKIRALKDIGSQSNFITEKLANKFNFPILNKSLNLKVTGFNSEKEYPTKIVEVPLKVGNETHKVPSVCVPNINISLKLKDLNLVAKHFISKGYELADNKITNDQIGDIDFILGTKSAFILKSHEKSFGSKNDSVYAETNIGIMLMGDLSIMKRNLPDLPTNSDTCSSVVTVESNDQNLESNLNFGTFDGNTVSPIFQTSVNFSIMGTDFDNMSNFDLEAEALNILNINKKEYKFDKEESTELTSEQNKKLMDWALYNSERDSEGHLIFPLLWNSENKHLLAKNFDLSKAILNSILNKYKNKPELLKLMDDNIREKVRNEMVERIPNLDEFLLENPTCSMIPHMPVFRLDRETTKCRQVLLSNLSEKRPNVVSHNQAIHPGPVLNQKVSAALGQLRFGKYLLGFDLEKAFNQIKLTESDSNKLIFLWFKNPTEGDFSIEAFRNVSLPFGLRCSPALLMLGLYKILILETDNDSEEMINLKRNIYQNLYVDNGALCADDSETLNLNFELLSSIFKPYGFSIQQIITNVPLEKQEAELAKVAAGQTDVKVLGMMWDTSADEIYARPAELCTAANTKRSILKTIASQYDLPNINGPILNRSRLFLHKFQCDKNLGWDEVLDDKSLNEWGNIAKQFNSAPTLKVNRCVGSRKDAYDLIACVDASKNIYGVIIYLYNKKTKQCSFFVAKNRIVSSEKTIPALELQAILLGVNSLIDVFNDLSGETCVDPISIENLLVMSDSLVSLHWINSTLVHFNKMNKLPVFVVNRLNEINRLSSLHPIQFKFIEGQQNPADYITRCVSYKQIIQTNYLSGPKMDDDSNSNKGIAFTVPNAAVHAKTASGVTASAVTKNTPVTHLISLDKYSSFKQLCNVHRTCEIASNRFKRALSNRNEEACGNNSNPDFTDVKFKIIQTEQKLIYPEIFEYFSADTHKLKDIPDLVSKFNLFVDERGILRVRGKFDRNVRTFGRSFPILLPKDSLLTTLIVRELHETLSHIGLYALLSELRKNFYIPSIFSVVKKILRDCVTCKRLNKKPILLNQSPYREIRMDPPKVPFAAIYADYIGSFTIENCGTKSKAYILCITCMWSRAVSLQVCSDATVEQFLLAYQKHCFLYGIPQIQISDLGSNLVCGSKMVAEFLNDSETLAFFSEHGVKPTKFEHFYKGHSELGSLVEIVVKFVKRLLFGSIRNNVLTFEEFIFSVAKCNHLINRRPIAFKQPLRDIPDDQVPDPITPEMLIYGRSLVSLNVIPQLHTHLEDPDFTPGDTNVIRNNFGKLVHINEKLSTIYHEEFLTNLVDQCLDKNDRYKPVVHFKPKVNDVVLIKEQFFKPFNFPMGKITKIFKNESDEVTHLDIKKGKTGEITKRHVSNVIPLLTCDDENQNRDTPTLPEQNSYPSRPLRKAAVQCRNKNRKLLKYDD